MQDCKAQAACVVSVVAGFRENVRSMSMSTSECKEKKISGRIGASGGRVFLIAQTFWWKGEARARLAELELDEAILGRNELFPQLG